MAERSTTLMVVLLVVGLAIGAGVGYYAAPAKPGETVEVTVEVNPLEGLNIQVAEITSDTQWLESQTPFTEDIIMPDINEYLDKLGYDVTYVNLIDDSAGQAAIHLEKVQSFKAMGVNLVIGGRWSSQAEMALSYVNENNMLLFSPSSTSPLLAFPDDNLYRMCPTDRIQAPAIAEMLWSWGIEACLVIQRGDSWADGIYNIFEIEYPKRGGVILGKVRYAAEVVEFSSYMETANSIITEAIEEYGVEKVAPLFIGFSEGATLVTQAADYPTLMSVYWFSTDGTVFEIRHLEDAPKVSAHMKLFGTLAAPGYSPKYSALAKRYRDLTAITMGFYDAADYDCNWVLVNAVLEAGSVDALDVIPLIRTISDNMYGASGWCRLNDDGDRDIIDYDIWGIDYVEGEPDFVRYGLYDGWADEVTWFTDLVTPGSLPPEWVP